MALLEVGLFLTSEFLPASVALALLESFLHGL